MEIKSYNTLPVYAVDIRNEVFVKEQGFQEEFDDNDKHAIHLVGFINNSSAATARILENSDGSFLIGRIAVRKQYRKQGLGAEIIKEAEQIIAKSGGKRIYIHAQCQAIDFYEKQGYSPIGEIDYEEDCPHKMMIKDLLPLE